MNLAVYEWRKLFRLPALWAFLALCLAFNGLLIATLSPYDRAFFNETSQTAKALGQRVDEDFLAGLDAIPATENRDLLRQSVTGMEDIFETYDTGELSDFYAGVVEKSPLAVTWMTWKYDLLASRVEHLAQTDAALDLYAGPATSSSSARCPGPFSVRAPFWPCWGRCICWATRGCTAQRAWPAPPERDGNYGG